MGARDFFPIDLIDAERDSGFSQQEIENTDAHYAEQPPTISAVVYPLSLSRRIVKMRLPGDRVGYQLQRYGRYFFDKSNKQPGWLPDLGFSIHDPVFAVQYFQTSFAEMRGQGTRIIEVTDGAE